MTGANRRPTERPGLGGSCTADPRASEGAALQTPSQRDCPLHHSNCTTPIATSLDSLSSPSHRPARLYTRYMHEAARRRPPLATTATRATHPYASKACLETGQAIIVRRLGNVDLGVFPHLTVFVFSFGLCLLLPLMAAKAVATAEMAPLPAQHPLDLSSPGLTSPAPALLVSMLVRFRVPFLALAHFSRYRPF